MPRDSPIEEDPCTASHDLEDHMPLYLGRFKYSADAIKAMVENPQDRGAAAAQAAE